MAFNSLCIKIRICLASMMLINFAGNPNKRRSTTRGCIYLGGILTIVSRSSVDVEYRALAFVIVELRWCTFICRDLKLPISQNLVVSCDNKLTIFMDSNLVIRQKSKHIDTNYHFIRELVG